MATAMAAAMAAAAARVAAARHRGGPYRPYRPCQPPPRLASCARGRRCATSRSSPTRARATRCCARCWRRAPVCSPAPTRVPRPVSRASYSRRGCAARACATTACGLSRVTGPSGAAPRPSRRTRPSSSCAAPSTASTPTSTWCSPRRTTPRCPTESTSGCSRAGPRTCGARQLSGRLSTSTGSGQRCRC